MTSGPDTMTNDDFEDLLNEVSTTPVPDTSSRLESDDSIDELLNAFADAAATPTASASPPKPAPKPTAKPVPKPTAKAAPKADKTASAAVQNETPEDDTATAANKIKLSSIKDHAKKKGMWAGALKPVTIPDLIGAVPAEEDPETAAEAEDGQSDSCLGDSPTSAAAEATPKAKGKTSSRPPPRLKIALSDIDRAHTPALLKIIDEIIVNATDHAKGQEKAAPSKRVTQISVTFDRETGQVSVYNDGPGIPIAVHPDATESAGRRVYTVEVNFAWFLAGTNIDKELSNVKGGINGLGAKLANVHSAEFAVETVYAQTYYRQEFRDRLDVTRDPVVVDLHRAHNLSSAAAKPHTRVTFTPAYKELGYRMTAAAEGPPRLGKADADDLDAWIRLRTHQAAAYVGAKVAVTYNGDRCETTDAAALGRLLLTPLGEDAGSAIVLSAQAKATEEPYKQHPWNIAVVVLPPGRRAGRRAAAQNMTIVNGVLSNKGSHVQYLKKMLSAAVEEKLRKATKRSRAPKAGTAVAKVLAASKVSAKAAAPKAAKPAKDPEEKKMSVTETLAGVRLVMCGAIPGADWGGQRKDELSVSKDTLEHYSLTATFLRQVGDAVAERILLAQGAKTGKVIHDKYTRARNSGKAAHKRNTYLMAAEGDSAITLLRAGLTQARGKGAVAPGGPTLDWCGIISLQGVIVNAARQVTELETSSGEIINVRSAKLQTNKRLLALADAMGLRYDRTYTTPEELATLNYGQLLLCVDQDLDGTGKIAALVLVWIHLFWPALIRAGRVGRLMTPLVRMYPKKGKGAPVEFYYEEEMRNWLAAHPDWEGSYQKPKYYKGLAGHSEAEVKRMFTPEAFTKARYTYTPDDGTKRLFEVYFGADPSLRKEALVTPVAHLSFAEATELHRRRQIPVGRVQLDVDTKAYKNDAIKRQIPGAVDGLNPARRKIIMGAIMRFAGESAKKEIKVFQLGGYVADKCFYHHGDASLNGTTTYLAQAFPGARRYPYLVGVGMFGSRHGDKAGSARYINVRLSPLVKAVFPPADRWHLPYVFEDGDQAEPQYFVPVAPMAVLESYKIVSEGWNHDGFGRELETTLTVVEAYIRGDAELLALADRLHAEGAAALPDVERLARSTWHLPASTRGYDGEVRYYKSEAFSFGRYNWDEENRTLVITELPMGVATSKYLEMLVKPGRSGKDNARIGYIEEIEDRSSDTSVELHIRLREGACETIKTSYGDPSIDPFEDLFMLRASMRPHLNYYSAKGGVLEFGECYLAAVLYWAPLRRALYFERLTRERIVATLRILEEEQILRYIGMAAELDLAHVQDDAVAEQMLRDRDFPPLHKGLLHRPEYTPNADLHALVTAGPGASLDYILDLKERDLVQSAVVKRQKVLEGLREDLARVTAQLAERPIAGASVWTAELAEFRRVVALGDATAWKFE